MKAIVEMLETRLQAAMLAGDVVELDDLIADDLIFTDHAGNRSDKAPPGARPGGLSLGHAAARTF